MNFYRLVALKQRVDDHKADLIRNGRFSANEQEAHDELTAWLEARTRDWQKAHGRLRRGWIMLDMRLGIWAYRRRWIVEPSKFPQL